VHAFSSAPRQRERSSVVRRRKNGPLSNSINDNDDDHDKEEWRAFRARLVQNGLPSLDNNLAGNTEIDDTSSSSSDTTSNNKNTKRHNVRYAHESTPLVEVGSILVSIPTTDLCQGLEQQYWHRSVVLITKVSDNVANGNVEDTVPEEQLAQGRNRGRWSYRGLLLNRCTNLLLEDGWRIQRGGDLLGLDSSDGTEYLCLHHDLDRSDSNVRDASTKLVGNLYYMTLADAQNLCKNDPSKYHATDFLTFGGFSSWRPGQLELEMGDSRNEWLALSVDGQSIWDELQWQKSQSQIVLNGREKDAACGLLEAGTDVWRTFLNKIHVSESKAIQRLPAGQLQFYDRMLEVWADDYLNVKKDQKSSVTTLSDSSGQIGPGTLVRAKSPPSNDMLLYDAEFIRSLVLVLDDTPDATVGIILNHPMSAAIECKSEEDPLPLRYGGPIDVPSWKDGSYREDDSGDDENDDDVYEGFLEYQDNDVAFDDLVFDDGREEDLGYADSTDDDDSSFIWIHRDAALGSRGVNGGGGTQLGTLNLWLIKEDDALESLQSGFLRLEDVMVFSGVCIWEKVLILERAVED